MSTILYQTSINVALSAEDAALAFAVAPGDIQMAFLVGLAEAVNAWTPGQSWPMQCRYIADEMTSKQRAEVASLLDILLEHLLERRP